MTSTDTSVKAVAFAAENAKRYTDSKIATLQSEITRLQRVNTEHREEIETHRANAKLAIRLTVILLGVALTVVLDQSGIAHIAAVILATSPDICREVIERLRKI